MGRRRGDSFIIQPGHLWECKRALLVILSGHERLPQATRAGGRPGDLARCTLRPSPTVQVRLRSLGPARSHARVWDVAEACFPGARLPAPTSMRTSSPVRGAQWFRRRPVGPTLPWRPQVAVQLPSPDLTARGKPRGRLEGPSPVSLTFSRTWAPCSGLSLQVCILVPPLLSCVAPGKLVISFLIR